MRKFYLCFIFSYLLISNSNAQISLKGMYIDSFNEILGNTAKEDSLLHYAQDSSYNYLALYSLHQLNLNNTTTANTLASFIYRARVNYGITYVGAVCETYSGFQNRISPYNLGRTDDNERFNVFNLEFEFWTNSSVTTGGYYCTQYLQQANCSCDTSGGFQFFIQQMRQIDSLAATQGALSETYVGWFNQGQAQQIASNADRILLHAYRTGTSSLFSYSSTRLQYLASLNTTVQVAPIFSAEPNFMGPWLNSHAQIEAYNQYKNDFNNSGYSWTQYINVLGYQWFDYGFMPKPVPGSGSFNPTISASGPLNVCSGGSITLTATSGDTYQWSNGATTQSITTSTGGTYNCSVTLNGNTQSTPSVTVNIVNNPTVSISEGNNQPSQVTLNSTSNAGSGSIATYQWLYNGGYINGASQSTYNATLSGDYSLGIVNSYGCYAVSNTLNVTVTSPNCTPAIPTGLTSNAITEVSYSLHWNSGLTGDSIIVRYHPVSSPTYSYVRMAFTGQTSTNISNLLGSTLYSWNVKTVCGGIDGTYSSNAYFTTGTVNTGLHEIPQVKDHDASSTEDSYGFRIYPNPAVNTLNLEFEALKSGEAKILLYDLNNRLILDRNALIQAGKNKTVIELSAISKGIYFIHIKSNDEVFFQKLIVDR